MRWLLPFTLLVASILFTGTLQAQRWGGTFRGGAPAAGHIGFRTRPGIRVFSEHHRFNNFDGFGSVLVSPFWYGEPFGYEQPIVSTTPVLTTPAPPVTIVQPKQQFAEPQLAPASPKVIELPGKATAASKPLPPAIFILADGERLEAHRYMLTHENLYATVDRQQRTIPLSMLDISATVAADHARGIDLRIPADRNELSLSF